MYRRKKAENLQELVASGRKKWVRYEEGAQIYSMGIHSFEKLAKDAGAVYRINRIVLVNVEKLDEYMEIFREDPNY